MVSANTPKTASGDILIVDDETANLKLLKELLSREGYQARPADRPQLAIKSALAQPPALILLDVKMPEMDGFAVCRRLKQNARTSDIPVIFISARHEAEAKVLGFEAGGVDFITKPFQEEEVLARVRTHLELRDMRLDLERLVAERTAKLTRSEAKYRTLVDNALVGVFASNLEGRFTFVNDAMARMFDFDGPDEMMARGSRERWRDPQDRERMVAELQKHGQVTDFETKAVTRNGRCLDVLFSAKMLGGDIFGMVMDITARKQVEQDNLDYQRRLKALAAQLTITEEKTRHIIAAGLHDHVGQPLALARMQLAAVQPSAVEPNFAQTFNEISDTLFEALENTQTLMLELSAQSINSTGLSTAISDWLESQIESKYDLKTSVIDNLPENRRRTLDPDTRSILFRNVRELLVNVVKHARANSVSVRLEDRSPILRIIVEDDGIGFNPQATTKASHSTGGFGLFSVRELMIDIGGDLRIVSTPGKGCTAILSAPF